MVRPGNTRSFPPPSFTKATSVNMPANARGSMLRPTRHTVK